MAAAAAAAAGAAEDVSLTQTQPFVVQTQGTQLAALQGDLNVHARLISVTDPGFKYEFRTSQMQVDIGRHPECEIRVDDKRVSGRHCRITRDESFHYFVEELSANCCFINEHLMQKGDTRALRHGDELSLCVSPYAVGDQKPFAAYIFRVADHEGGSGRPPSGAEAEAKSRGDAGTVATVSVGQTTAASRRRVTEEWVRETWDTRTVLGSGNFSEVRLGVHVRRGEKCAVKVIDVKKFLQFQCKRESQLSLSSEAELLTSLQHPGIVRFYEWFQTDVHLYLIMELMEGGDLLQSILEDGHFAELQARQLFQEVCEAVRYLHAKNVVHRDLKPENILLTSKDREDMHPKIADFGLARKNMQSRDCKTFCGTPHYFAPEVINTFRDRELGQSVGYGKTVDMWSLGVILYILLSGIPPFEEEGLYEQILDGKYEFDVREWTTVSPEAKQLVRGLMTVNPKERLTIEQAFQIRWLRLASGPQRSAEREVPAGGEPAAKKLRADDGARAMANAAAGPLGA